MIRRLLLLCALLALACESAYGVELGKLQLHSALNQRFDADVPLTNVAGLGTDEILPGLASAQEFDRMGIDRPYELTDLHFAVEQGQNGQMVVHITSSKPIVEPYLDFLMEVLWPNGRIVREYTVLLDPPVFGKSGVQQLNAPSSGTASAPAHPKARTPAETATAPAPVTPAAMSNPLETGRMSNGHYGVTGPGDTLWKIAMQVRPNHSVSIQQTMLAIERANPDAFINGNINLLKAGRVLRIPDIKAMQSMSFASAVQAVKSQNDAFTAYKHGAKMNQLDASQRQQPSTNGGSASQAKGGELRLLTANRNAAGSKGAGGTANSQALQNELATTKEDLDKAKRANTDLNGRIGALQGQLTTLNNLVKLKDDQLAALRAEVQKMQSAKPAAPARMAQTSSTSPLALLSNPYVLIVLGLVLVGVVAAGLIYMRRRRQPEEFESVDFDEVAEPEPDDEQEEEDDDVTRLAIEDDDEELSPQTADVIGEAEIYIAYGRFPQAITFLQNAIEAEPDRTDIQLKLLEVYVQTEDVDAFNQQFEQLAALGDESALALAQDMRQRLPGAAELDISALDIETAAEPAAEDEDEDLSFDLDDLDAETEEESIDLGGLDDAEEMDIDLDLDADEEPASELSLEDTDLDLDLEADSTDEELGTSLESLSVEEEDDDDGAISLDEADLEGADLDLELEEAAAAEPDAEDAANELTLGDSESALELEEDDGLELSLDDTDDDGIELDLEGADDDGIELDLEGADDEAALDLDGLELDDDGEGLELNLDEDASTKLDLARAYIDMGDSDGARNVLQEVIEEGSASEIQEANELLAKID